MNITLRTRESAFVEHAGFQIGLANTPPLRKRCNDLVNAMYAWRGYETQSDANASAHELTLHASCAGRVIGTLTICRDSLSGIPADVLYKKHVDAYRTRGASVCELTRFAIEPAHRSKDLLGALFYHAYLHGGICGGLTDAFIEVNPRHVAFYKRLLRFQQIGEEKTCERVNAPAVLLHREVSSVAQQIAECREHAREDTSPPQPHRILAGMRPTVARRQAVLAA